MIVLCSGWRVAVTLGLMCGCVTLRLVSGCYIVVGV